jgi:hypothetical protein
MVLVIHSARRGGKRAALEAACAELKRRGFEVLEVTVKSEEALLGRMRHLMDDRLRDLYLAPPSGTVHLDNGEGMQFTDNGSEEED